MLKEACGGGASHTHACTFHCKGLKHLLQARNAAAYPVLGCSGGLSSTFVTGLSSTYKQRGPNEDVESVRASRPLLSPSNNDPKAAGPPRSHNLAASFSQSWLAGSAYVLASSAMILFNKHALSGFNFECPSSLLLFHCLLAVVFVKFMAVMGYHVEPLRWSIAWRWMPVNLLFVGECSQQQHVALFVGVQPSAARSSVWVLVAC
eukprot:947883-Pelagomonas_calceolata.AAC.1